MRAAGRPSQAVTLTASAPVHLALLPPTRASTAWTEHRTKTRKFFIWIALSATKQKHRFSRPGAPRAPAYCPKPTCWHCRFCGGGAGVGGSQPERCWVPHPWPCPMRRWRALPHCDRTKRLQTCTGFAGVNAGRSHGIPGRTVVQLEAQASPPHAPEPCPLSAIVWPSASQMSLDLGAGGGAGGSRSDALQGQPIRGCIIENLETGAPGRLSQ